MRAMQDDVESSVRYITVHCQEFSLIKHACSGTATPSPVCCSAGDISRQRCCCKSASTPCAISGWIMSLEGAFMCTARSPSNLGTTWKCTWNTTCPAAFPLFCTMLTPSAPEARITARANLGSSFNTSAATSSGISITVAYPVCFGTNRQCPLATGNASKNAMACSVSKTL